MSDQNASQASRDVPSILQRLQPWNGYIVLGVITGVLSAIAIFLMIKERRAEPAEFAQTLMLPGLSQEISEIARLEIITKDKHVIIEPDDAGKWAITNHNHYPVRFDLLRQTLLGFATLTLLEKRTARTEWHHYLDLVSPDEGGNARRFVLYGKRGQTIADILVGKFSDYSLLSGETRFYVRHTDEAQSYLAKGSMPDVVKIEDWLDTTIISIPRTRIAYVDMAPVSGPPYRLEGVEGKDDFALNTLPKGRLPRPASALNAVAGALVGLAFEDVQPAGKIDFKNAAHAHYVTKDGLVIDAFVTSAKTGSGGFLKLSTRVDESLLPKSNPQAATGISALQSALGVLPSQDTQQISSGRDRIIKESQALNARLDGWAYKIPAFKADLLSRSLSALLEAEAVPPVTSKNAKANKGRTPPRSRR